jgi:hypothetical protein
MGERVRFTLKDALVLFLKHPSPRLLALICLSSWGYRASVMRPFEPVELGVILGVMLYWPFQEWWMHRYLLHLPPIKLFGREYELNFSKVHRLHHDDPKNIPLTFLPLSVILGALAVFIFVAYAVCGDWAQVSSFMGATSTCTLLYEWVHYLTHTDYVPRGAYYKKVWRLHRWHHYKHEGYWFSFTVPWMDDWLGTGPAVGDVSHSPTAKSLRRAPRADSASDHSSPEEAEEGL